MHSWMRKKNKSFVDFQKGKKESINFINNGSKILDIGCGDGRFFDIVKENKKNCKFYGHDIEKSSERIIEAKGYNFLKKLSTRRRYDVISMFELIEHLYYEDFVNLMKKTKKMLKKKGYLIITTPNFANITQIEHFWDNVQHVRPFNKEALLKYFGKDYELIEHKYFCRILNPVKILRNLMLGFKPFLNQLLVFQKK